MKRKCLAVGIILLFIGISSFSISSERLSRDDTTPPVTTATVNPPYPNGMNGWYISPLTVTLTATDDLSGVNATFYRINDMDWQLYITPFIIDHDGMYTVEFYSTDHAGNSETLKSVNIKLDQTPPYIVYMSGIGDNTSGVDHIDYYINHVLQFTASPPGPYWWTFEPWPIDMILTMIAYDVAGNNVNISIGWQKSFAAGIVTNLEISRENITCFAFILFSSDDGLHVLERVTFPNAYAGYVGGHFIFAEFRILSILHDINYFVSGRGLGYDSIVQNVFSFR